MITLLLDRYARRTNAKPFNDLDVPLISVIGSLVLQKSYFIQTFKSIVLQCFQEGALLKSIWFLALKCSMQNYSYQSICSQIQDDTSSQKKVEILETNNIFGEETKTFASDSTLLVYKRAAVSERPLSATWVWNILCHEKKQFRCGTWWTATASDQGRQPWTTQSICDGKKDIILAEYWLQLTLFRRSVWGQILQNHRKIKYNEKMLVSEEAHMEHERLKKLKNRGKGQNKNYGSPPFGCNHYKCRWFFDTFMCKAKQFQKKN